MQPEPDSNSSQPVTVAQVHAEFERLLRDRNHMGVRNLIGDALLEPRNPFQKTQRRPKKWMVALLGFGCLVLLVLYSFRVH